MNVTYLKELENKYGEQANAHKLLAEERRLLQNRFQDEFKSALQDKNVKLQLQSNESEKAQGQN